MRAAVIGLGVEGKKALKSLIKHGWKVYGSDLQTNLDLSDLPIPLAGVNINPTEERISFITEDLTIDLGFNNHEEIDFCDAIVLSPGLWNSSIAEKYKKSGKLLCDIKNKHRNIFTIGITGTNGKTTSVTMLKEILENAGKKVLVGGNGGGGFEGYYDLILEAEKDNYDIMLVEVCDMTLQFCDYFFDFDLLALTNIGNDHMNVHGSIENYKDSLKDIFTDKTIIIDKNQKFNEEFEEVANSIIKYNESNYDLNVFGKFNRLNAGLASTIANYLNIEEFITKKSLEEFIAVEGRLEVLKLNDSKIFIGKSDNSDAMKSILEEEKFYAVFVGTPRINEEHRLDILNEVVKFNPKVVILFPGLEDTINLGLNRLQSLNYSGRIEIANNLDEIIAFVAEFSHETAMLIGGNGQKTIIEIQERLRKICELCN